MKIAYTIHELVLDGERISPKSVVELDEKTFAELDSLGAIRDASDEEIAVSGAIKKPAAPAAPAPRLTAAEKKAAAKKAEEDAAAAAAKKAEKDAAAADPDVVPNPAVDTEADLLGGN